MESPQQSDATKDDESAAWLDDVHNLILALQGTAISEVEIRFGETAVLLRRRPGVVSQAPMAESRAPSKEPAQWTAVQAPLNGIYYDRSSPEADPFVQVGDSVESGQVVAIIEAMKVFNEIHAEETGHVTALLVESGDMVESGQDLIALDTKGAGADGS
ncbi:MAG: acetyl-CoA carboxylase [Chloroflexi bacterium]|nr:acetyl-CoA carboxylase [Chloroflexota bacterium]